MNTLKSKLISALSSLVLLLSIGNYVSATDLNLGGFSGTLNTTVSSGFAMRTEGNDCRLISGEFFKSDWCCWKTDHHSHLLLDIILIMEMVVVMFTKLTVTAILHKNSLKELTQIR